MLRLFLRINSVLYSNDNIILNGMKRCLCSESTKAGPPENDKETQSTVSKTPISKAMKAYLERARAHDDFMYEQNKEFQIGKRHLANMMGEDPETFTQDDVDRAIEYLFPSGLFEKKARPMMKHPEEVFPKRKAAEFSETGRPFHFLFYTSKPNFFNLLHNVVENINELNHYEDVMTSKNSFPDPNSKLNLDGYQWIDKNKLEGILIENINDKEYNNFLNAMERLYNHPYAYRKKDFILNYRKPLLSQATSLELPKLMYGSDGKSYVTVYECLRKSARGHVTIRAPGSGIISINGNDLSYFKEIQPREQIIFPLVFTKMLNKVDIEAHVEGGGPSGQAGAIRWGISMGLRCFVDEDMTEKMRIAGLLTRDYRTKERKKPGQEGARRKFTWKKR